MDVYLGFVGPSKISEFTRTCVQPNQGFCWSFFEIDPVMAEVR